MVIYGLSNLRNYAFSKDIGTVTVRDIQSEKLNIRIYRGEGILIGEEVYYKDQNNEAKILGLSKYLEQHLPKKRADAELDEEPFTAFRIIFEDGTDLMARDILLKFCMAKTPYREGYANLTRILSRHRSVKILPWQEIRFSSLVNTSQGGCKLVLSVTYRKSDNVGFLRTDQRLELESGSISQVNYILTLSAVVAQLRSKGYEDVSEDNILSLTFAFVNEQTDEILDAIKFGIDRKTRTNITSFLYDNLYGVPEIINFLGREKESLEGEASFGVIEGKFTKLYDDQKRIMTAYSGFISIFDYRSIVDMTNSHDVYLVDKDNKASLITITEYELSRTANASTPIAVNIKYRLSDECQNIFDVEPAEEFMNLFDENFTKAYE